MASRLDTMPLRICFIISFKGYKVKQVKELLDTQPFKDYLVGFSDYAYIIHDRDINEDGEVKTLHIHFCGKAVSGTKKRLITRVSELSKIFNVSTLAITIDKCEDIQSYIQYLIHKNDTDKFQYDIKDIVSSYDMDSLETIMNVQIETLTIDRLIDIVRNSKFRTEIMRKIGLTMYQHYRSTINDLINDGNLGSNVFY